MIKNKFKRISIIGSLAVLLASGLGFGVVRMIAPLPIFGGDIPAATQAATQTEDQTVTSDTDNIQDENINEQDDAQEANGAVEVNESASDNEQGENLPGGGHEDTGNTDHQFEGVE
ncbi:MAG: hypothetical protein NTZ89_01130 [Actinobacteria bacterium]|nr:hypothetical protein [Actinomycetota bacterium]